MKKPVNYLSNKNLIAEYHKSIELGRPTETLGRMFLTLAKRYASKPNFSGYTYVDDMQSHAVMQLCQYWDKFNPEKSDNAFAYYTQVVKTAFFHYLKAEKAHRELRDLLLVEEGLNPSHSFMVEHETSIFSSDSDN